MHVFVFCLDGNSDNEEGFDHPPSSSSDESASDDDEEAGTSDETLNSIISKLNSAGITVDFALVRRLFLLL